MVQFDFQQKHPGPTKDTTLYRERAPQHNRTWGGYQSYYPAENIGKQLRTSEACMEHLKSSDIIMRATITVSLVQIEEYFNIQTKKLWG